MRYTDPTEAARGSCGTQLTAEVTWTQTEARLQHLHQRSRQHLLV